MDFINRHKWLVTILSIIFIGLPQYIDSLWGLAEKMLGRNIAMPNITWAYWITVPLGVVMFGIAIWAIKSKKPITDKTEQDLEIAKRLTDILTRIHKRDLKLTDKALKQYLALFNLNDFRELWNNYLATVKNEHKALLEKVKKDVGRKKLSKDRVKKRRQIDELSDKLSPLWEEEWTLDKAVSLGNCLDKLPNMQNAKYKGITKLRGEDGQWNKLFNKLNNMKVEFANIFADESLNKMVNEYIGYSFAGSSLRLLADLFNKLVPVEITPSEFIKSGAYDPRVVIESCMTRLLEDITNRIKQAQPCENWIDAYRNRYGKLPLVPDYLKPVCEFHPVDQPVSKDMELKTPSGQLWSSWTPPQREEWRQLVEWCGKNPQDYLAHMKQMLPKKAPKRAGRWKPPAQH